MPVDLPRIIGHQDINVTSCPGTIEALLPSLREAVTARYDVLTGTANVSELGNAPRGMDGSILVPAGQPVIADLNGDGRDDVFWYRAGPSPDELWLSAGSSVTMSRIPQNLDDDGATASLTALDWDGDGAGDVLAVIPGRATATLLQGRQRGSPEVVTVGALEVGIGVVGLGGARVLAGDFDGDGDDDALFADSQRTTWALLSFNGTGATTAMVGSTLVGALGPGPHRPVVGDFDGDLRDDVLWYGPADASDTVWYGRMATGSIPFDAVSITVAGDHQPLVADLDGDQRDDVVWRSATSGASPEQAGTLWWAGQRQRGFVTGRLAVGPTDSAPAQLLEAGDLNGGGSADLVVRHDAANASVRLRQGARERVALTARVPAGATPLFADFDGDGRRELLWWSTTGATSLWRANR